MNLTPARLLVLAGPILLLACGGGSGDPGGTPPPPPPPPPSSEPAPPVAPPIVYPGSVAPAVINEGNATEHATLAHRLHYVTRDLASAVDGLPVLGPGEGQVTLVGAQAGTATVS